jgi:2-polyprenyl-3-methyl-5-hydroxy-6-metoxy-1,4-benzoquinol methylase/polysaccharide pyruvyl transferase WcaK-like protein
MNRDNYRRQCLEKQRKLIWHVGAWSGNFGDSIIQQSISENLRSLSMHQLEFKYINCQQTEFTSDLIAEMNQEAHLLLVGGGGMIFHRPQDKSISGWQFNIDINLIDKIKVPFVVYGVGFNKFEYDKTDFPPITNKHLIKTVEKATLFSVRNNGTKRELIRRGCNGDKIHVIPDSGMFLEAKEVIIPGLKEDKLKVAINWTTDRQDQSFPAPWEENKDIFIKNLLGLLRYLIKNRNAQIFYIGHMGGNFDRDIIEKLREGLGADLVVIEEVLPFLYPPHPERAKGLIGVYKQMDLVLGMRGHSNIVAFGQHVPFIPIGSHRKNRYFIEDIGEPYYIFDVREGRFLDKDRMIQIVERLLNERDKYINRHYKVYHEKKIIFDNFNSKVLSLIETAYEKCPHCGGEAAFYTRTNRYEIYRDVVRCKSCDLIYLSPLIRDDEHEQLYREKYRKLYRCPSFPEKAFHDERMPASVFRMNFIKEMVDFTPESSLLDVGCGGGTFLRLLKSKGYLNIKGVEIEPKYSRYIREQEGIEIFQGSLEAMPQTTQYDVITMWHVLEHVYNLAAFLSVARRILKDDGWLFIEVPVIYDINTPPKDAVTFQIAHNYYFTPKTLKKVLSEAGFRIVNKKKTSTNFYILACRKCHSVNICNMKKILIATYLQRHLKKILPIIIALEKHPDIDLKVLLLTREEWDIAEKYGIEYSRFDDYTDKKRRIDFDLEWALEPLINAIDIERPDMFLGIEVNYILRNAIHYCREIGIKSLIIQHGTPNKYSLHAFAPFEADCFAAWGDFTRDFLVKNGVDPERIVVTGGPVFDRTPLLRPDRDEIYRNIGIDQRYKKVIVFTTQGPGPGGCPSIEEIETGIVQTCIGASHYPDVQLLFQVHPSQKIDDVQSIVDRVGTPNAKVIKYHDTESLMAISNGVITFFSTTAIDALILDKPLMLINLSDDRDFYPFVKMKAALGAYMKEEIQSVFRRLIESPEELRAGRKKAIDYVAYKVDGRSLERVVDLIEHLLEREATYATSSYCS